MQRHEIFFNLDNNGILFLNSLISYRFDLAGDTGLPLNPVFSDKSQNPQKAFDSIWHKNPWSNVQWLTPVTGRGVVSPHLLHALSLMGSSHPVPLQNHLPPWFL